MRTVTFAVSLDEPAYCLKELDEVRLDKHGTRRVRIITVVRGDNLADFRQDLGLTSGRPPFVIPGGVQETSGKFSVLHTVGELVDIADWLEANPYNQDDLVRTNLIEGYYTRQEMLWSARHK